MKVVSDTRKIVFFDGVCNLCNFFVDFVIRRQAIPKILVAPLQGATARVTLGETHATQLKSVIYFRSGRAYFESSAALLVLWDIGGFWKVFIIFYLVPSFLRDMIYHWVAKNRYRWFGKKQTCRLPTENEKAYFLD